MWYDRRDAGDNLGWTVRFSASLDGADTFLPSVPISEPHRYTADGALMSLGGPAGPRDRGARASIRLSPFHFNAGHTSGLAAAADRRFHGFWVDNRTGVPQVWSAPLSVEGEAVRNGERRLSDLEDVSGKVTLRLTALRFDRDAGTAVAEATLENVSGDTIGPTLHARVVELRSEIAGAIRIAGADSGGEGEGAVLRFDGGGTGLPPGGRTASRTLRFMLSDPRPEVEGDEFRFGVVDLRVRILAEPLRRTRQRDDRSSSRPGRFGPATSSSAVTERDPLAGLLPRNRRSAHESTPADRRR